MKIHHSSWLSLALISITLIGELSALAMALPTPSGPEGYIPLKWAVIVMGGFNYYRDPTYNAIQRIEKIMQGRGVPFDLIQDDAIVAPSDNPPAGLYSLQYANGSLRYQVIVLLFDYEPYDNNAVNQNYIRWAVGNGTNAVLFGKAPMAIPELLGLASTDVAWYWGGAITTNVVLKTFNDGNKEYAQGLAVTLGIRLYYFTVIRKMTEMTVWINKTWGSMWSLGMANTTYGNGDVWYLDYSLNEFAMDVSAGYYPTSWSEWRMEFWGHAINFALSKAQKMNVAIMPYKRWKGAWVVRIDTDSIYWKNAFLPPESVLQAGWTYDYQYCVLGYARTSGTADLPLVAGAPSGYSGIPSTRVMRTSVTGVMQTNSLSKNYMAIIYNSTVGGVYDRIKLDFNENTNFADDTEYRIWENMTYPTVLGKLYWNKITPSLVQPTMINVGWWQTPMLMQDQITNLPKWKQYGSDYGLTYSLHGWQHVSLEPGGSTYAMWNGEQFLLNATYIAEKFSAARYWMTEKFDGTGHGFEENEVIISHPLNSHPTDVDNVIDDLSWVLFQYDAPEEYVGFGLKSATSKYTLSCAHEPAHNDPARFAVLEDIAKTLYPVISTFAHGVIYNTDYPFQPYSNTIKPASAREAFYFWLNSKQMLQNTPTASYKSDRIVLEFNADPALREYVWRFPAEFNGKQLTGFFDNRSIGQVEHIDADYVYIGFSQGQGAQRIEVVYGTPVPTIPVTVTAVSPLNSGTTSPTAGTYNIAENTTFSISATPLSGYTFDHWELDGANVGSQPSYSFNVGTSSHTISAFFAAIPTVTVTVSDVSPLGSGTTNPAAGEYQLAQNTLFEISAMPASLYDFDHWELDGVNVGSSNPYSLNVGTSDHTFIAVFTPIPTVNVAVSEVSPLDGGTTNPPAGTYPVVENSQFSITATPNSGYIFDHWELDGANVGSQPSYSFNVGTSSHTISAFFSRLLSTQIDSCDSLQNWQPRYSTLIVEESDFQEGTGAITVATMSTLGWNIYALLFKPMNFSQYSSLQIWIKASDATRTLRLMVATNWSNYNVYTITGLASNSWTLVSINLSSPTSRTGTVDFGSISFVRFEYEVRYTVAWFGIDDIRGIYG